ncbi:MAG: tetratricopeptide repeat protein [Ginsengibacter sp.]
MKKYFLISFLLLKTVLLFAQDEVADSLATLINKHLQQDSTRVILLNQLTSQYLNLGSDKTIETGNAALELSEKINYVPGKILALERMGNYYQARGDYSKALQIFDQEKQAATSIGDSTSTGWVLLFKGGIYQGQSNYPLALQQYLEAVKIFENTGNKKDAASVFGNIGVLYQDMREPGTAQKYFEQGLTIQEEQQDKPEIIRFLNNLGGVYTDQNFFQKSRLSYERGLLLAKQIGSTHYIALISRNLMDLNLTTKDYAEAFTYGFKSLELFTSLDEAEGIADIDFLIAQGYVKTNKPDSAIFYGVKSVEIAKGIGFIRNIYNTYGVLAEASAMKKNFVKAYEYQQQYALYKDSLNGEDRKSIMEGIKFKYDLDKKQSEIVILRKDKQIKEQEANRQKIKAYAYLVCFILAGLLAVVLITSNRRKQKNNTLLQAQKEKVEITLSELKSTQQQLIQSEKMASLGELTAGIAHEIQNPLNFVNNFSEVNKELIDELQGERSKMKGERDEKLEDEILNDLKENSEKINHHGKRADAIVKGMLQHSRSSTGVREPTNINTLADEYLRLSYHGLRAKDKTFNAELKTDFDNSIEKINIIPQDIGRVLLNLYNNAFYAVNEKKKLNITGYEPNVTVQTKKINGKVEIRIGDNGNGIPQNIVDKIFQPFFTTKPTGEGTGLGLSLSYDIIKAHGGEINAESKEGAGTTFLVKLMGTFK